MKNNSLHQQLIAWRRDFHQHPETGFLEMRTASIVAGILDELGFELALGKEVMLAEECMGKPDVATTKAHLEWARKNGANLDFLPYFTEGYTGIVATLNKNSTGPIIAFRFDMDALDIDESNAAHHFPNQRGFRSIFPNKMHACGHDAHTSIGLGLATMLAENKEMLYAEIRLIFQPAEEGTRGAKSMVAANVVKNVDYFIASHIGMQIPHQHFLAANNGFLATSKLDILFHGMASHAGATPEIGKNALLAAASAALHIHAIPRHSEGASRVNVGELHAGSGRNVIAHNAQLTVETRGETSDINQYVKEQVETIVYGAAKMHQVDYSIDLVGEALNSECSPKLAKVLEKVTKEYPAMNQTYSVSNKISGSEDATYFMNAVQNDGGLATYCIFGTELAAGHHHEAFDINEDTMLVAVEILYQTVKKLCLEDG